MSRSSASPTLVVFDRGPSDGPESAIDADAVEMPLNAANHSRHRSEQVPNRRSAWRVLAGALLVSVSVVAVAFFRPQALGGPASYGKALTFAMAPTIPKGDVVVAQKQSRYQIGDIIVYRVPDNRSSSGTAKTVLGRIAWGNGVTGFVTKGDGASAPDRFLPKSADVVGKVWFHLGGTLFRSLGVALAIVLVILLIAVWPGKRQRHQRDVPEGTPANAGTPPGVV